MLKKRLRLGTWGCFLPGAAGFFLLAWGISRLVHWASLDELGRLGAVVLTVVGAAALLVVVAVFLILRAVGRALGQMKQDAVQVVESLKYMANMPNKYGQRARLPDDVAEAEVREVREGEDEGKV